MTRFARLSVALALIGVLVACANTSQSSSSSSAEASASAAAPAASAQAAAPSAAMAQNGSAASDGAKIYAQNCSSCHQPNGQGVKGTFPPLVGNPTVTGFDIHVIHIVKFGLTGPIKVNGVEYNGVMPGWAQQLSDADIAAVLTYIRSSWGNRARAISAARVAAVQRGLEHQPR